ncbi:MAG: ribosomal subunit interface protein [Candidatus Lambdaproteobacteria bacterium RIFOXYD12_FULL_49_8]|uniref:Ribosome hibernation promoting factor n=1 Tax=Candidatus Lambdaproteobacteria bacterium RIFOXYD2_FULL_50_16 TaxID=1817772 RepID=A0A1F6GBG9_9PROT|nr:MAG: ribosomal subunit interface protein [Candidatus Lambdaproteobacteria bacterium RIFOXYD2_FULL_50_16]OGG97739.1 MAG: ribosomal subunit interface protein [Candidatus Lambdaproteobacteria bacterium RIFOXYD12_FULL_49_8]
MEITISAKHMELTDALKNHVEERVIRIKKYSEHRLSADIHLGVEKHRHQIHATVKGAGATYNSEAEDPQSMYKAIDLCVDKLEKQLRRSKKSNKAGDTIKNVAD